jgi:hypothetical protein
MLGENITLIHRSCTYLVHLFFCTGEIREMIINQSIVYCCHETSLKVHKHEIFLNTFFAETETIWSQGPVTRDF